MLVVLVVVAIGFAGLKVGAAWMDVTGIEADLEAASHDLPFDCAGSRSCGDKLIDAIEDIRVERDRDVVLDYESIDIDAENDAFIIKGSKVMDFYVRRYVWRFDISIPLPK